MQEIEYQSQIYPTLKKYFGYDSFREHQQDIIEAVERTIRENFKKHVDETGEMIHPLLLQVVLLKRDLQL